MARRRRRYKEGDVFAIPLESGGHGVGVVARMDGTGTVFGYFFGPRNTSLTDVDMPRRLNPKEAVLLAKVGDPGLMSGEWKVVGHVPGFSREQWPMPAFGRIDEDAGKAWRVLYSEEDLCARLDVTRCSMEEARALPEEALYGYGALALALDVILK